MHNRRWIQCYGIWLTAAGDDIVRMPHNHSSMSLSHWTECQHSKRMSRGMFQAHPESQLPTSFDCMVNETMSWTDPDLNQNNLLGY